MEGNSNRKPKEQGRHSLASNNANEWRSPDERKKVVDAIVKELKTYYPAHTPLNDLEKTALKCEEKIYGMVTNKDDYIREIKGNFMKFGRKFKKVQSSNVQSGSSVNGTNTPGPAAQSLTQGQSIPTSLPYTQTPRSQQWLPQNNIQSNLNIPESSGLPNQVSINVPAAQNLNIHVGEGAHVSLLPGSQRKIHGREELLPQYQQPQKQPQSSSYLQNVQASYMQQQAKQQQQQTLLKQPIQQQLSHQTSLSSIQQSLYRDSALSSLPSSGGQQKSQFLSRNHQFPTQRVPSSHHQQHQISVPSKEPKLQEHEQLISQLMNVQDTHQNHQTSLHNNGEKQEAFRVSSSQQNHIARFQERSQQNLHQQQHLYSHSTNASALSSQQQQYRSGGHQSSNYNVNGSILLGAQGQEVVQSQPMTQQHYQPKQNQSQPHNRILQQPLDDTQRFQASGYFHQTGNVVDQQNQPYQLQRTPQANPSTSHSTCKMVKASGGDWQEETYQKIKALKDEHIHLLNTLFQMLSDKLRKVDSLPQENNQIDKQTIERLTASKKMLQLVIVFLNVPRNSVSETHRDKFCYYEEHVLRFANPYRKLTQKQQLHLPHSQSHQTTLQSQSGHQVHVPQSSDLTMSHTAMPHSSQTRTNMEPKEGSNIMTSSGHVSLKQTPASNPQPNMFQQKQFHHLPMQQQILQKKTQPETNHQQLQMPTYEMNDVRMRQHKIVKPMISQNFSPPASSPQIQNYSSPQLIDQQILPTALNKTGTSSQFSGSPFVTSFAPSPHPGDPEKPISIESPDYQLQPVAQEHPSEPNAERPIDCMIKTFQSSSPESLAQSVSEMSTVISLTDMIAGSVQSIGGSRGGVAEDSSARKRLRVQQGETNPTKKFKRSITTLPIDITAETDSYEQFSSMESEIGSTESSGSKVNKIKPGCALLQEMIEVNGRLLETMVSTCSEDVSPSEVTTGTIVTCSYVPVASQIQPLRLLVPENYPHSPILIEKMPFDASSEHKNEDLSSRARSRFYLSMKEFSEPMSLTEIAQTWDDCARATMTEYSG